MHTQEVCRKDSSRQRNMAEWSSLDNDHSGWILRDPSVPEQIDQAASFMSRRCGYNSSDLEDLKQDIRFYLLEREDKHDPTRGSVGAYVNCLLQYWRLMTIRYRKRLVRRGASSVRSFHDTEEPVGVSDSEVQCADIDTKDLLNACMARLSSQDIELVFSVVQNGKARTADHQSISRRQVDNRLDLIRASCSRYQDLF